MVYPMKMVGDGSLRSSLVFTLFRRAICPLAMPTMPDLNWRFPLGRVGSTAGAWVPVGTVLAGVGPPRFAFSTFSPPAGLLRSQPASAGKTRRRRANNTPDGRDERMMRSPCETESVLGESRQ